MKLLRFVVASVLIGVLGFFGILFYFGDFSSGETLFTRLIFAAGYTYFVGVVVGVLLYDYWKLSIVVAWGTSVLGILGILSGEVENRVLSLFMVGIPVATAAIGGYIGSIGVQKLFMKKKFLKKSKALLLLSGIIIASVIGTALYLHSFQVKIQTISSYEECVKAGYPIMESYPERCMTPDGMSFTRVIENETITVSGIIVCLPHRDQSGPQTLECAFGLKTKDGIYYSLRDTDSNYKNISQIPMNTQVMITGSINPIDDSIYMSAGVITIKSMQHVVE